MLKISEMFKIEISLKTNQFQTRSYQIIVMKYTILWISISEKYRVLQKLGAKV
jgi:hypothetical protein